MVIPIAPIEVWYTHVIYSCYPTDKVLPMRIEVCVFPYFHLLLLVQYFTKDVFHVAYMLRLYLLPHAAQTRSSHLKNSLEQVSQV